MTSTPPRSRRPVSRQRLGTESEDSRRLNAIREVHSHFDWEHHDRQLALEAIERIADEGQP